MKHEISNTEMATILAALRWYQSEGFGDPSRRPLAIHEIATDGWGDTIASSLDNRAVGELCERLNTDTEEGATPVENPDIVTVWNALHGYREDCIPEGRDYGSYDRQWDDICTAMARIQEDLNCEEQTDD
jgi:hypothetical protein